jgi:glycosyltransferase involved in cell wall biosynthesis
MVEISVIMPVCNTKEEYLREAIKSVLNQNFKDFEFLILNDSPDNKAIQRVIADYTDDRIKYMENPTNIGIPQSYNKLQEMATGKYIAIMNHDDIMHPHRLAKQYNYLEKHPEVGLLGSGYKKFGEINRFRWTKNPSAHAEICAYLLFKSAVHHPTIMMRRAIMTEHRIRYNENFISLNDRLLCCEFSKYSKLSNLPDTLYKYRFHKDMTSKKQKDMIRSERAMFHKLWFAYNNIELTPEEVNIFDHYTTYGRQKVRDLNTLKIIVSTLEKLANINQQRRLLEPEIFTEICAKYATKRCLNALLSSRINIKEIIKTTSLPVNKPLLLGSNMILGWKK